MMNDKSFRGSATVGLTAFMKNDDIQSNATIFCEVYRQWKEQLTVPAGMVRAHALHQVVDHHVAKHLEEGLEVSCKKGCAHCCHLEVSITSDEAVVLANIVKSGQVTIETNRLKRQAEIPTRMDGTSEWRELPSEVRRCVFLGTDNLCSIYEQRPAACRKYFVRTPPENCKDIKGASQIVSVLEAEIATSAAYNVEYDGPDSIAKKLLPLLEEKSNAV